jgi:MFS family permease
LKQLFHFLKSNASDVSFGWVLTFLSSFGQTFLISLYVPKIIEKFSLTEGSFGGVYAIATIISSVILISVGHTIDHKSVKKVTAFTLLGLACSTFLLGFSHYHIALLIISLIGLRLCGQGLLSHISLTVMSRHYQRDRGKALSIASLGYAMGEAIFPIGITTLIALYGYEIAARVSSVVIILYLIRLYFIDTSHFDNKASIAQKHSFRVLFSNLKAVIKDKRFLIIMPSSFTLSFTATAVFFYQYVFVQDKGWSAPLYATFFTAYALTRFVMSIFGGLWVDKFSAQKLFRFYLIPMALGLLPFAFMEGIIGALLFLLFAGVTTGIAGTVKTAVLAEVYGVEKLGTIRSLFTMFMVLSTALGPLIIGMLIDYGVPFYGLMLFLLGMLVLATLNAQRIKKVAMVVEE